MVLMATKSDTGPSNYCIRKGTYFDEFNRAMYVEHAIIDGQTFETFETLALLHIRTSVIFMKISS